MKKESVFMQMHNGKRPFEGSFYQGLQNLFYIADNANSKKLVSAFPEFFGDDGVPEFGVFVNASFHYNGWFCVWDEWEKKYYLFTPCKENKPLGHRDHVYTCETAAECREYING